MKIEIFSAFRSRNYRLFFAGQSISLIGTWMQRTAVWWVVYVETHSNFMVGVTAFATQLPSFVFSLYGGVVSDRYDRYRLLLTTQIASLLQAVLLAVIVLLSHYAVWQIIAISVLLGIINAFDVPARQSLVYDMVDDKNDLPKAIALNSSMVNLARIFGPTLSGLVLATFGAGICFVINAVSFLAVILSLLMMKLKPHVPQIRTKRVWAELKEGFVYLKATPTIGFVVLFLALMSFFALPFNTLLPHYAKDIFKGNGSVYGILNGAIGIGAICLTIFLASLKTTANLKKILLISALIFGTGLILFSHTINLSIACIFLVITGFGMMAQVTVTNTIIQTTVSSEMRGRVISYYAMAFFGMSPLGGLLVGWISDRIGAPNTILAQGVSVILISGIFLFFVPGKNGVGGKDLHP